MKKKEKTLNRVENLSDANEWCEEAETRDYAFGKEGSSSPSYVVANGERILNSLWRMKKEEMETWFVYELEPRYAAKGHRKWKGRDIWSTAFLRSGGVIGCTVGEGNRKVEEHVRLHGLSKLQLERN